MKIFLRASMVLLAFPLIGASQTVPIAAPAPSAPPVASSGARFTREPILVRYGRTELICDGAPLGPVDAVSPIETAIQLYGPFEPPPVTYAFRIDAQGRPLSIRRIGASQPMPYPANDDVAPALAATRFAAGSPHALCTITFTPSTTPIASAPAAQVARVYAVSHRDRSQDRALWMALKPVASSCYESAAEPRTIQYPDYAAIPGVAGRPDYAVIVHDIDEAGRPTNLRVLGSSANAAFDQAMREAVTASRFAPAAKTGCVVRFSKGPGETLPAPSAPEMESAASCKDEPKWESIPDLVFPPAFNRRAIEGWAVIRYDVAPWGQTGNIEIVASEPAAEFGEQAKGIIQRARKPKGGHGLSGCIQRVRFAIARKGPSAGGPGDAGLATE